MLGRPVGEERHHSVVGRAEEQPVVGVVGVLNDFRQLGEVGVGRSLLALAFQRFGEEEVADHALVAEFAELLAGCLGQRLHHDFVGDLVRLRDNGFREQVVQSFG